MQNDSFLEPNLKEIKDACWTYLLPSICAFSLATNFLNIIVFSNGKLLKKNPIYVYMLINSIINFLYSFICSFVFVMRCGNLCNLGGTYLANFFELYVYAYFTSVLGIFNIFIEIAIAIQRYLIITNKKIFQNMSRNLVVTIMFIVSIIYYIPTLYWRQIVLVNPNDSFTNHSLLEPKMYKIKQQEHEPIELFIAVLSSSRGLLILVLLFFINLLTVVKFKNHLKNKEKIQSLSKQRSDNEMLLKNGKNNNNNNNNSASSKLDEIRKDSSAFKLKRLNEEPVSPATPKTIVPNDSLFDTQLVKGAVDNRKAKKNLTRMVIIMSILFLIGNLPHTIALMLLPLITQTKKNLTFLVFFIIFSNSMLFASHGACIFVYYFFNRHFRNLLNFKMRKFFGLKNPQ